MMTTSFDSHAIQTLQLKTKTISNPFRQSLILNNLSQSLRIPIVPIFLGFT